MLLANLPATSDAYFHILHMELGLSVGGQLFPEAMTVEKFVNDALMVIFFFTVGLEIRREISHGQLSTPKKAILPIIAAIGGMLVPAIIFISINGASAVAGGWGIPTATDIAFAIAIMSLLGDRVPLSLKVFLTADAEERARRRALQNRERGYGETDEAAILADIIRRDKADSTRETAPLKPAEDSVELNSTGMTIEQVCERICELAKERA
jgi:hypothetical protein